MAVNETLRQLVLDMDIDDRTELLEDIRVSLDPQCQATIDAAWAVEVEARLDAYEADPTGSISLEALKKRILER